MKRAANIGTEGTSPAHRRVVSCAIAGTLVLAVFGAFFPVFRAQFVNFDDPAFVMNNPRVHGISPANIASAFTEFHHGHWHPLTNLSWMLDYELAGGLRPEVFHATNAALHAIGAVLVYFIFVKLLAAARTPREMLSRLPIIRAGSVREQVAAGLCAAFYAIHPLRVESVAWITERRDVLSAALLFAATLAYLASVRPGSPGVRSKYWLVLTHGLLALSLLAKAWGMSFFAAMLVLDVYPLRRVADASGVWSWRSARALLVEKLGMIVLGGAGAILAAGAQRAALASKTLEEWPIADRLLQSVLGLGWYARRTLIPGGLSPLYELPASLNASDARVLVSVGCIVACVVAIILFRRARLALFAGALWYVICLLPVLGLLQSGEQLVADRYALLACLPVPLLIALGALAMLDRYREDEPDRRRSISLVPVLALIGALTIIARNGLETFAQSRVWRDSISLWRHAAEVTPTPIVLINYAQELYETDPAKAREVLEQTVRRYPNAGRAWFLLGLEAREQSRPQEAAECFRQASRSMEQAFMALVNLGGVQMRELNDLPAAIESFRAAVADVEKGGRRDPAFLPYLALGDALKRSGDVAGARAAFAKALDGSDTREAAQRELQLLNASPAP